MSGLSDGYGDGATVTETLADFDAWLHHRAHQMLASTDHRHDDLVQEGRIAMWRAHAAYDPAKGALPSWLTRHATWHMREVLTRSDRWTGRPPRPSTSRVKIAVRSIESLDVHLTPEDGARADDAAAGTVPDIAERAMAAYHRGEIAEAMTLLSDAQRRYVRLRFAEGMQTKELKQVFGYDPSALWNSAKNGAKHKLRAQLSHLEAA